MSLLFAAFAALQLSSRAEAQRPSRPEPEWYGWQNLAFDSAAVALVSTSLALDATDSLEHDTNAWLFVFGLSAFALGSPIFDWVHGNVVLGLGSLGLRLVSGVLMLFGGISHALGCEIEQEEGRPCSEGTGYYVGGLLVGIGAIALDGVLDYEQISKRSASLPINLALHRDGAVLAFTGTL